MSCAHVAGAGRVSSPRLPDKVCKQDAVQTWSGYSGRPEDRRPVPAMPSAARFPRRLGRQRHRLVSQGVRDHPAPSSMRRVLAKERSGRHVVRGRTLRGNALMRTRTPRRSIHHGRVRGPFRRIWLSHVHRAAPATSVAESVRAGQEVRTFGRGRRVLLDDTGTMAAFGALR